VALFKFESPDEKLVREIALQGRECCRLLDVLGTFGDRGMGILLPDTGPDGGKVAAQRILGSYLSAKGLGTAEAARLRIGMASHPEDGGDSRDLLLKADERAGGCSLLEPLNSL
jgi:GGDEF domain-containing protein